MKTRVIAAVVFLLLTNSLNRANAQPLGAPQCTHPQLRAMMQEAHTRQQYKALASYFRFQQVSFERQAQSEKQEWERRSQDVSRLSAKYPRPVDASRNRYEYFMYEAGQMNREATHYEDLAAKAE